ncbi:unnamed protein product [Psylliodes chrysocephalus]|uniref:Uncharacterized protein n=1 Tax=Psylliodes chrysocephalus TaxID=3402493 RepID=A0A9P0GF43_9CUCU|nr:unnamed protein product [Psylliodes chrysocephala]
MLVSLVTCIKKIIQRVFTRTYVMYKTRKPKHTTHTHTGVCVRICVYRLIRCFRILRCRVCINIHTRWHPTRSDIFIMLSHNENRAVFEIDTTLSQEWSGNEYPRTAMCVRNVDVHVSCSSQVDAQLAAFFIDPRAK